MLNNCLEIGTLCILVFTDDSLLDIPGSSVTGDVNIWSVNEKIIRSGPLEFVTDSRGFPVKQLNRILSSDIEWSCYEVRESSGPRNTISVLMLFVRRYLCHGRHVLVYSQCGLPYLDPNIPVFRIDVASMPLGWSLLGDQEFESDILYSFHSSKILSDSYLLDRMCRDDYFMSWNSGQSYWGNVPKEPTSLRDFVERTKCNGFLISVHGMGQTVRLARLYYEDPNSTKVTYGPLEIVDTDEDRCLKRLEYDMHEVHLVRPCESQFLRCRVLAYMVYSKTDSLAMQAIGLGVDPFVGCGLRIAVIVDVSMMSNGYSA